MYEADALAVQRYDASGNAVSRSCSCRRSGDPVQGEDGHPEAVDFDLAVSMEA
jgi:hypothetical protein